jgi:hypothetical protein
LLRSKVKRVITHSAFCLFAIEVQPLGGYCSCPKADGKELGLNAFITLNVERGTRNQKRKIED